MATAHDPLNPENEYDVPAYLEGLFTVWSLVGPAGVTMITAHDTAEILAEGAVDEDGVQWPKDQVLNAWLDSAVETPEDWDERPEHDLVPVALDGQTVTNHDMIVLSINALALVSNSLRGRLDDLDGLPDWLA